ncbi:hypothetical protein CJF42_22700 [Pseudoalteromonas sp. NBT06-2]|uniref:hypothetical protein n=1 Tax=Pseudoalteromonas sp. NBT06-2 TaxID=2025950 RepID=UPI000BA5B5EC|nr:hypothetical protein [Pseudoalteromonas sp. NBT06-2]PAJ72165.1 hypothetical protein CJF42_22700 [Pseudoalteromonas sp. NBT06-2]
MTELNSCEINPESLEAICKRRERIEYLEQLEHSYKAKRKKLESRGIQKIRVSISNYLENRALKKELETFDL